MFENLNVIEHIMFAIGLASLTAAALGLLKYKYFNIYKFPTLIASINLIIVPFVGSAFRAYQPSAHSTLLISIAEILFGIVGALMTYQVFAKQEKMQKQEQANNA